MLCEAMCDAGGSNQRVDTIGNLGLWTELGIPTKAARFKTHHLVHFFSWHKCLRGNRNDFAALHLQNLLVVFGFPCFFDFYVECTACARMTFLVVALYLYRHTGEGRGDGFFWVLSNFNTGGFINVPCANK